MKAMLMVAFITMVAADAWASTFDYQVMPDDSSWLTTYVKGGIDQHAHYTGGSWKVEVSDTEDPERPAFSIDAALPGEEPLSFDVSGNILDFRDGSTNFWNPDTGEWSVFEQFASITLDLDGERFAGKYLGSLRTLFENGGLVLHGELVGVLDGMTREINFSAPCDFARVATPEPTTVLLLGAATLLRQRRARRSAGAEGLADSSRS